MPRPDKPAGVLITGSSGFLGRHLLAAAPPDYRVLAHYCLHPPALFHPGQLPLKLNFLDEADWQRLPEPPLSAIIHTAALADPDACEENPVLAERMNVTASERLADFAGRMGARFIFVSSDMVFDGRKGNYRESDKPNPLSVYGITKMTAEHAVLSRHPDAVVARAALMYGKSRNGRAPFTERMLEDLRAGRPVRAFTDQYRSPVLVDDLAAALWELVSSDFRGILHLGGPQRLSRLEMARTLGRAFHFDERLILPVKTADVPLKAKRPLDCSLNISRAKRLLKTPLSDFEAGIRRAFSR